MARRLRDEPEGADEHVTPLRPFRRNNGLWIHHAPAYLRGTPVSRVTDRSLQVEQLRWLASTGRLTPLEVELLRGGHHRPYATLRTASSYDIDEALAVELLELHEGA